MSGFACNAETRICKRCGWTFVNTVGAHIIFYGLGSVFSGCAYLPFWCWSSVKANISMTHAACMAHDVYYIPQSYHNISSVKNYVHLLYGGKTPFYYLSVFFSMAFILHEFLQYLRIVVSDEELRRIWRFTSLSSVYVTILKIILRPAGPRAKIVNLNPFYVINI